VTRRSAPAQITGVAPPAPVPGRRRNLNAPAFPNGQGALPGGNNWAKDVNEQVILLEFMQRGTLGMWLAKANKMTPPGDFDTEALWRIFNALITACVSMLFPPRFQVLAPPNFSFAGGPLPEVIPGLWSQNPHNIVNMDIDPSNVFVGDFDMGLYRRLPIHKVAWPDPPPPPLWPAPRLTRRVPEQIGDMGLAVDFSDLAIEKNLWSLRAAGKRGYQLPEQWDREWVSSRPPRATSRREELTRRETPQDAYTRDPRNEAALPASAVAAQYNEKSNIWQVGWVMWALITRLDPWKQYPPLAATRTFMDINGAMVTTETHGWLLDKPGSYPHASARIKAVVMQCLCHMPADRPSLADLVTECGQAVAGAPGNNAPGAPASWASGHYGEAVISRQAQRTHPWQLGERVSFPRSLSAVATAARLTVTCSFRRTLSRLVRCGSSR